MSLILLAAAINHITLSEQDAWLALAEAAMWLVLVLFSLLACERERSAVHSATK